MNIKSSSAPTPSTKKASASRSSSTIPSPERELIDGPANQPALLPPQGTNDLVEQTDQASLVDTRDTALLWYLDTGNSYCAFCNR